MKKLTLDTNVLISGTFWNGSSFKILERVDQNLDESVSSKDILLEYERIIKSSEIIEKIKNNDLIISKVSQKIIINSTIVEPKEKLHIVKDDPDDDKILECAKKGRVDFIITNDQHLLKIKEFEGIEIITPDKYLDEECD